MNSQPTTQPQHAPAESKCFLPALGLLFGLGAALSAWQVVIGYQSERTSGWFLVVSLGVGLAMLAVFSRARVPVQTYGPGTGLVTILLVAVPIVLPHFLFWLFNFGADAHGTLGQEARSAIKSQAQGMILLGVLLPIVVGLFFSAWKKPLPPQESELGTNH